MNEQTNTESSRYYPDFIKSLMPVMEGWSLISRYQKIIYDNYTSMSCVHEFFRSWIRFAPNYLSQVINPWSFSLMNFTKQIKGSPELEYKILTEVDGYGAQLGTIIDYMEVLSKNLKIDEMKDEEKFKYFRFKNLSSEIQRAKDNR